MITYDGEHSLPDSSLGSDWLTQMYMNLVEHYYTDYRSLLSTTTICGTPSRLSITSNPGQILQNIQLEVSMKPNFTSVPAFLGIQVGG